MSRSENPLDAQALADDCGQRIGSEALKFLRRIRDDIGVAHPGTNPTSQGIYDILPEALKLESRRLILDWETMDVREGFICHATPPPILYYSPELDAQ
jgi:hypothetical protein